MTTPGGERGHLMVGLMIAVAILVVLSTAAYQAWEDVSRREMEAEMIFRAEDICRALRRYRQDHAGQLPTELDQLAEPGTKGQYYVRKLWTDPLVKSGKWGLLYAAPGGGVVDPSAVDAEGASAIGGSATGKRTPVSIFPKRKPGGIGGDSGEMEGLPIAGVKSLCTKKPFRVRNDESEYAKWLFTVFDLEVPGGGSQVGGGKGHGVSGGAGQESSGGFARPGLGRRGAGR